MSTVEASLSDVAAAADASAPRVSYVDENTGVGTFAARPYEPGDCVLREVPYVFAQSYRTWNTTPLRPLKSLGSTSDDTGQDKKSAAARVPALPLTLPELTPLQQAPDDDDGDETLVSLQQVRCCFGCGAPLPQSLEEECKRLERLSMLQQRCCCDDGKCGEEGSATHNRVTCREDSSAPTSLWVLLQSTNPQRNGADRSSSTCEGPTAVDVVFKAYVTEVDMAGVAHVVYFCGPRCETQSLLKEGKRFVLCEPLQLTMCSQVEPSEQLSSSTPYCGAADAEADVAALRYPTYGTILKAAQLPTSAVTRCTAWPTRLSVLSTLHSVARRHNERVWLLVLLLAKELHTALMMNSSVASSPPLSMQQQQQQQRPQPCDDLPETVVSWLTDVVAVTFRARLESLCEQYAEGAMHLLHNDQKAMLRFSWQLLTWWWVLCCLEAVVVQEARGEGEGDEGRCENLAPAAGKSCGASQCTVQTAAMLFPEGRTPTSPQEPSDEQGKEPSVLRRLLRAAETVAFPLQLYLQLYWLTNANAHMYVVATPLYSRWCRWLANAGSPFTSMGGSTDASDDNNEEIMRKQRADTVELFSRLYALFHGAEPWSAKLAAAHHITPSLLHDSMADVLHATGVALYDRATKLNHSCDPNVCFQPNSSVVEASVVALRHINVGEEILTSYIRPDQFNEGTAEKTETAAQRRAAAQRRRCYLLEHYGFLCRCPLCAVADEDAAGGAPCQGAQP
jgi:hypothetical protein